ncbi:S8 family peptidase [Candidatus Margulisiibacteriota bacterium]
MLRIIICILFLSIVCTKEYAGERRDYAPGILIVKAKHNTKFRYKTTSQAKIRDFSTKKKAKFIKPVSLPRKKFSAGQTQAPHYLVSFDMQKDIKKKAEEFAAEEWIEYAEPNYYVYANAFPNDPKYIEQSYLHQTDLKELIKLPEKQAVIVAVIDSGIDMLHPDIVQNIYHNENEVLNGLDDDNNGYVDDAAGYNFANYYLNQDDHNPQDINGHGTHIAGIIAAGIDNNMGIAGINQKIKVLNIRFLDATGKGTQLDAAAAIRYAVDMGARIINCSWGYYKYNQVLEEAIEYAVNNNVLVIAAVGNLGSSMKEYPAAFNNVLGIAAIDLGGQRSNFSSFGEHVDYAAYGNNIFSLLPHNQYGSKSGTSQAAAIISGITAKIVAENPGFSFVEINNVLQSSISDLPPEGKDIFTGHGRIDVIKLYQNLGFSLPSDDQPVENPAKKEDKNIFQLLIEFPIMLIKGFLDIFF